MNKVFNISLIALLTFSLSGQSVIASGLSNKNSNLSTAVFSATHNEETLADESSQIIEDWMIDVAHWDMQTGDGYEFYSMNEIEAWMLDNDHWNISGKLLEDSNMAIEQWMTNSCHWNFTKMDYCEGSSNKDENELQSWMTNPYFFQI